MVEEWRAATHYSGFMVISFQSFVVKNELAEGHRNASRAKQGSRDEEGGGD